MGTTKDLTCSEVQALSDAALEIYNAVEYGKMDKARALVRKLSGAAEIQRLREGIEKAMRDLDKEVREGSGNESFMAGVSLQLTNLLNNQEEV